MKELKIEKPIEVKLVQYQCPGCEKKFYVNQDDVKDAGMLNDLYNEEYGLVAKSEGWNSNIVRILVPGYDDVTIKTNLYTDAGANEQMKKLRQLILLMTKKDDGRLAKDNDWVGKDGGTDKYGVPNK